jgi:hypothetical protein
VNRRGQFSIIAALLITVVLVSTVMITYTMILNDTIQVQPQVLTAIDETNFAIKQLLGFSVGYYGSVIRVTGDTSFANQSTLNYTTSGLEYVANTHAEWGAGFSLTNLTIQTNWFNNMSYSTGYLDITYNLTKLGIYGMEYAPSCGLTVHIANATQNNQTSLIVTQDQNEPVTDLGKQNFQFFQYQTANSTWTLVPPSTSPTAYTNGTYQIQPPAGIDANSYVVEVTDQRGIIVVASPYSAYNMNMTWPTPSATTSSTYYYVNNNAIHVDSNGNYGTDSNFPAQQYGPDRTNDTLTEANSVSPVPEAYVYCNNYVSTWTNPTYAYDNKTSTSAQSNSPSSGANTTALVLNLTSVVIGTKIQFWVGQDSGGSYTTMYIDVANQTGSWVNVFHVTPTEGSYQNATFPSVDYTAMRFYRYRNSGGSSTKYFYINETQAVNATWTPPANYRLDLEEQWTNINYGASNASLDIFTGPFSSPAETLSVQCWNASNSSWSTLISSLNANSWNNVSVTTYISGQTFTIRFLDGTQTGDLVQNSWQIDATLLYLNGTVRLVPPSNPITIELLQNGTMRWLEQSLQLTTAAMPIPPLPVKSIHVNQTINGVDSEVPFQIEDWASDYLIPLGLTSNSSVFNDGNMIVFLANNDVSRVTIWWNGSDLATQTPYAFVNRYFTGDNPSAGTLTNGVLTLQFGGSFTLTSTVGTASSTATFMRINNQASTYGASPAYIITSGVVRDIVQQEAEWTNGAPNSPNLYSHEVIALPANATYYTYELRVLFVQSPQSRTVSDLCPIELQTSTTQTQTENGTANGYPIVSNATGTFYNQSTVSAHHWSQLTTGANGAGIMFPDAGNNELYYFDNMAGTQTGGLRVNLAQGTIELLPVEMAPVNFTYALNTIWCGAVSTFSNTTPIYQTASGQVSGSWIIVEYPPTATVYTGD